MMRIALATVLGLALAASAAGQTVQDSEAFLRSISENVDSASNPFLSIILLGIGAAVLAGGIVVAARQDRARVTPSAHQPGKLRRALAGSLGLSSHELRQLTLLAEELASGRALGAEEALGLLLCPSRLLEASERPETRADRQTLRDLAGRFGAA